MVITGVIKNLYEIKTKNGKYLAIADLQRNRTRYPLIIFTTVWNQYNSVINNDTYISLEVRLVKNSGNLKYIVQSVLKD